MIAESKTNVSVSRVLRLNYEWQREVDTCLLKSLSDWITIDNCVRALRVVRHTNISNKMWEHDILRFENIRLKWMSH